MYRRFFKRIFNFLTWQEKFNLDVWYVDHLSHAEGQATMEPFHGNETA